MAAAFECDCDPGMTDMLALKRLEASLKQSLRDWEGSERGDALSYALSQVQDEIARGEPIGCNQCEFNTCFCEDSPSNPDTQQSETIYSAVKLPSDDVLLFRATSAAQPVRDIRRGVPRWFAVAQTFQLGHTYAHALCERFRLDPEEKVKR